MYTAKVYRGVFITSDIQYIIIPAARRARAARCADVLTNPIVDSRSTVSTRLTLDRWARPQTAVSR
jgi:hypothetical protein